MTTNVAGTEVGQLRYKPWGEVRATSGSNPADYTFTGQYSNVSDFGLLFYNARWYDSYLNRWTQPDTIVPDALNPQALDRYAYTLNNPVRYTDPSGHAYCPYSECEIVVNAHNEKMQLRGSLHRAAEGLVRDLGGINDLEAMASIVAAGASAYRTYDRLLPQLSDIFIGVQKYGPGTLLDAAGGGCAGVGREPHDCSTNSSWFGDTGFHPDFQDHHNQLFHLWAYIAQTSFPGNPAAAAAGLVEGSGGNAFHEIGQSLAHSPAGGWGTSWQDYGLSVEGQILGLEISMGMIEPSGLAGAIVDAVGTQGDGSFGLVGASEFMFGPLAGEGLP